jgi:hypothetical protein
MSRWFKKGFRVHGSGFAVEKKAELETQGVY